MKNPGFLDKLGITETKSHPELVEGSHKFE